MTEYLQKPDHYTHMCLFKYIVPYLVSLCLGLLGRLSIRFFPLGFGDLPTLYILMELTLGTGASSC